VCDLKKKSYKGVRFKISNDIVRFKKKSYEGVRFNKTYEDV